MWFGYSNKLSIFSQQSLELNFWIFIFYIGINSLISGLKYNYYLSLTNMTNQLNYLTVWNRIIENI